MGKATDKRRKSRQEFLSRLAQENPEQFKREWTKRVASWADEIRDNGKKGKISVPPVFGVVNKAADVLIECGEQAVDLELRETTESLNNECCRALSKDMGTKHHNVYKLNRDYEAHGKYDVKHRK